MRANVLTACVIISAAMWAGPASAQSSMLGSPDRTPALPAEKEKIPAPPAVPGATARPDSVAPADRNTADLPPTEALFDAINRGDILSARDAVARGADIDATNLLGLTPLELSVDLSRNDITFLLLSMRGSTVASRSANPAAAPPAVPQAVATGRQTRRRGETSSTPPVAVAAQPVQVPTRQAAMSYSSDGGSPLPAAGFLGFGGKK